MREHASMRLGLVGVSTAIALVMGVPVFAQGQQSGAAQGQNCQQQLSNLQNQINQAPQNRQDELKRKLNDARQAAQQGDEQKCMKVVSDLRQTLNQTAQGGQPQSGAQQAQAGPQPQGGQAGADITVRQPAPQVTVQQPAPQVTVQQPAPQVTVQQPEPQVTVQQPKPDVTVQQAKPEVTVQQAQPEVNVQRTARPEVEVQRPGQQQNQASQSQGAREPASGAVTAVVVAVPAEFRSLRAQELIGKDIYGARNEEIGEIEDIVINRNGRVMAALVDVGGFLGIGGRRVAIPMSELARQGDRIVATTMTKDRVERLEAYNQNEWTPFDRERQLSDAR